jgi:N-dimethylarginine dimethylaminohydrolase
MMQKNSYDKVIPTAEAKTPSDLRWPTFCMVKPHKKNFNVDDPNNVWMQELSPEDRVVDYDHAWAQWNELYQWIAANSGSVDLLPHKGQLQDLIYVANMGIYIEPADVIVISNFTSEPRRGEEKVGKAYFESDGYTVVAPPPDCHFEGEADLKFIRDNIFVGGYGMRSDIETFEWMEKQFNIKIVKCRITDERLYHMDCQFNPLTMDKALACTESFQPEDFKEVEKVVEVIDIPKEEVYTTIDPGVGDACNIVRVGANILVGSSLTAMRASDDGYMIEVSKVERLNHICSQNGLGLIPFNLSEFGKSGAALSCLVMHMNFIDFQAEQGEVM